MRCNYSLRIKYFLISLELPELRPSPDKGKFGSCQVALVDWVRKYIMAPPPNPRKPDGHSISSSTGYFYQIIFSFLIKGYQIMLYETENLEIIL